MKSEFNEILTVKAGFKGFGVKPGQEKASSKFTY